MPILPANVSNGLKAKGKESVLLESTTFTDLGLLEAHLEEFVRENPKILFHDEEEPSFLIVGRQVRNDLGDAADLVGLLPNGDLVVVEVKRDVADMRARNEAPEWQAIRYASSVATVKDIDELIEKFYLKYLQKHPPHDQVGPITAESARAILETFLEDPDDDEAFNRQQQVILVSSEFDERTKAACAWLVKNGVPLRCVTLTPHKYLDHILIEVSTILPPEQLDDLFVGIGEASSGQRRVRGGSPRKNPKVRELVEAGLVRIGDELFVKKAPERTARLVDHNTVEFEGKRMTVNQWGMLVTGWPSFGTFQSAWLVRTNESLGEIRKRLAIPASGAQETGGSAGQDGA